MAEHAKNAPLVGSGTLVLQRIKLTLIPRNEPEHLLDLLALGLQPL